MEHPWLSFKAPLLIESIGSTVLNNCLDSDVFSKNMSKESEQVENLADNSVSSIETSSSGCSMSPSPSPSPINGLSQTRSAESNLHVPYLISIVMASPTSTDSCLLQLNVQSVTIDYQWCLRPAVLAPYDQLLPQLFTHSYHQQWQWHQ